LCTAFGSARHLYSLYVKRHERFLLVKDGIWREMAGLFSLRFRLPRKSQGSFTSHKSATWDRRLYFPSEERYAVDFFARKIRRRRPCLNSRSWVQEASNNFCFFKSDTMAVATTYSSVRSLAQTPSSSNCNNSTFCASDNDRCFQFFFSLLPIGQSFTLSDIFTAQLNSESQNNKNAKDIYPISAKSRSACFW
jgi:hypothetical protein